MAKVKLIKGLSYSGIVTATHRKPIIEVDDDILTAVIATGYFEVIKGAAAPTEKTPAEQEKAQLGKLTREEVDKVAVELGIDTQGAKNKDEAINLILAKKYPVGGGSGVQE